MISEGSFAALLEVTGIEKNQVNASFILKKTLTLRAAIEKIAKTF